MTKHGFKQLSRENWIEPDELVLQLFNFSSTGKQEKAAIPDWLGHILAPALSNNVPEEVQSLFEVARGALVYGYFFYPLFTLAAEQLFRVAEAAITHKCLALGIPKSKKSFSEKLNWLEKQGIIQGCDIAKWNAIRGSRNYSSHPTQQSIITPGNAIGALVILTESINDLFKCQDGEMST